MLTYEELLTTLTEIEAVLNAWPITYVYDVEELVSYPLTHLIWSKVDKSIPCQTTNISRWSSVPTMC